MRELNNFGKVFELKHRSACFVAHVILERSPPGA